MRSPAGLSPLALFIALLPPAPAWGPNAVEAAPGLGNAAVVAGGVTEDATSSNNQVKLIRDAAGHLVVAYVLDVSGTPQVVLAVSRDEGGHWTRLAQVSSGPIPSRLPALGLDAAGRLYVIWTRYDDGVGKIYYRVWAERWAAPQERISPPSGYAGFPSLAVDGRGHAHVVWYGIREGSLPASTRHGSIYEIFYTGFDGRAWSPPRLISTGLPDSVNPALAADRGGRLHAVWFQYDGRAYQVRYAERDAAWSDPETVLATRADAFNPDVAVDARGEPLLVWERHDGVSSVIQLARRTGGRWQTPVDLSEASSPARHPSLSVAPSGAVYVVWDRDDGEIVARRLSDRWEPAVRLTADGGNTFPSVLASGQGAGVVWTHTAQGRSQVRYRLLRTR
ncbi:MAG TPA: hypothetical protein VK881_04800 [bacterium]|nr:hypothetical protein [bacterium]